MLDPEVLRRQRLCSLPLTERFELDWMTKFTLKKMEPPWGYGPYSEVVFYTRWSRPRPDGTQEDWADVIIRVIEGVMSIAKQYHREMGIPWDDEEMALFAREMALSAFRGEWGPPGRGYWFMGTELMRQIGSMGLNNCGAVDVTQLSTGAHWLMDALMLGCGVGFSTWHDVVSGLQLPRTGPRRIRIEVPEDDLRKGYPTGIAQEARRVWDEADELEIVVPDSREGWVDATTLLIASYETGGPTIRFDYGRIRPAGSPIAGFGGEASGSFALRALHRKLRIILTHATQERWEPSRLITDVMNLIGCMVVAGNVRRSALIALGDPADPVFADLKNYEVFPYRRRHGWISNNSYVLSKREHFSCIPTIAAGIKRNGEPGFINLLNIRKFGRIGDLAGTMLPSGSILKEDTATLTNPCVPGETRILTRQGYERIDRLVGVPVEIWNGRTWAPVIPRVTGHHQPMVRVTLSDGTVLRVTRAHRFHLSRSHQASAPDVVPAEALRPGDRLWKYEMPVVEAGETVDHAVAYSQGVCAGDGYLQEGARPFVWPYRHKQALLPSPALARGDGQRTGVLLDRRVHADKRFVPHCWDRTGRLAWLAGLLDTDGYLTKDGSLRVTSTDRAFLLETKLLLTTLGVQAKVTPERGARVKEIPDDHGERRGYARQPIWRLLISAADVVQLRTLGIGQFLRRIDVSRVAPQRDARQFVTVVSVEEAGIEETVYCFTEPQNHTGTFEGIVTGQCGEACLESYELCCLAELYPTRCRNERGELDLERFLAACRYATFYTTTVQLLPTHRVETNAVVARNRRTGISLNGAAALRELTTMAEAIRWMELGYEEIRRENARLAALRGVPESIRVTAEKPSGTSALIMGVPAGCHWPTSGYILRRTRLMRSKTDLIRILDEAGVPHEPDLYSANTEVFTFPVKTVGADTIRPAHEVSMWEQADFALTLARHFVDQAVSSTITFDPLTRAEKEAREAELLARYRELQRQLMALELLANQHASDPRHFFPQLMAELHAVEEEAERVFGELLALQRRVPEGDDVERLLASYAGMLKSMTMLPRFDHGYAQPPEEAIDRETYEKLRAQIRPLDWSGFLSESDPERYCASCEELPPSAESVA